MASSEKARSRADWKRPAGALARQRATTCSSSCGTAAPPMASAGASSSRMAASVWMVPWRWNGRWPVSISCSTQPSEKTSLVASMRSPRTCSGDM